MSLREIQVAFEKSLAAMTPALPTKYGNVSFTPPNGAYQRVDLVPADPANPTMGDGVYREEGFLQVMLCYPTEQGTKEVLNRAHLVQRHFKRGTSLTQGATTVRIASTPAIRAGIYDEDRYCVPIRIFYFAYQTAD